MDKRKKRIKKPITRAELRKVRGGWSYYNPFALAKAK